MSEIPQNHTISHHSEKPSFAFMRKLADYVTGLTSIEIENSIASNGRVYIEDHEGQPRLVHTQDTKKNALWFHVHTLQRRSEAFETHGPLEHMESFIRKSDGTLNRGMRIQQVSVGKLSGIYDTPSVTNKEISVGSTLALKKNQFLESDTVHSIDKLYARDRMYLRLMGDSHVYAISVQDSSLTMGNGQEIALCNITYQENNKEISCTGFIRLPLIEWSVMLVTSLPSKADPRPKIIRALNKKIENIKLRRRST